MERWLNGTGQRQIERVLNITKSLVQNIIDKFCKRGHSIIMEYGEIEYDMQELIMFSHMLNFASSNNQALLLWKYRKTLVNNHVCFDKKLSL